MRWRALTAGFFSSARRGAAHSRPPTVSIPSARPPGWPAGGRRPNPPGPREAAPAEAAGPDRGLSTPHPRHTQSWTTSVPPDAPPDVFTGVLVLQKDGPMSADEMPAPGRLYAAGDLIGGATVAAVQHGTSTDVVFAAGYYAWSFFAVDSSANYSEA